MGYIKSNSFFYYRKTAWNKTVTHKNNRHELIRNPAGELMGYIWARGSRAMDELHAAAPLSSWKSDKETAELNQLSERMAALRVNNQKRAFAAYTPVRIQSVIPHSLYSLLFLMQGINYRRESKQ